MKWSISKQCNDDGIYRNAGMRHVEIAVLCTIHSEVYASNLNQKEKSQDFILYPTPYSSSVCVFVGLLTMFVIGVHFATVNRFSTPKYVDSQFRLIIAIGTAFSNQPSWTLVNKMSITLFYVVWSIPLATSSFLVRDGAYLTHMLLYGQQHQVEPCVSAAVPDLSPNIFWKDNLFYCIT